VNIADVFFKALLDDSQLQVDASKAGDKAGLTMGGRLASGLKGALKTGAFAALAGGAAIAGKGLIELQNIEADFQAATGATAEEASAAGKAINEMGGRNLEPLKEIGATMAEVETRLNLTGDAAAATTEKFLKYGVATKQGPTAAVKDFDDILDAWNLTAADSDGIMDKLIVSHQKYGGSIEANQKSLAVLAPQLKALNLTVDDGIGLLNLFEVSGLDASVATRALNTAVKNLKPGQTLNDLIAQISSIEDPTLRAQKAIEIFGARGGVALANVLKPGITSLNDFEISATDAAGATSKASDAIEGTFSNQVALKIKAVGSAIIGVGQTIGPLGSALTGLISLGGALGFDKLVPKLGSGLAGVWKKVAASSLVSGAVSFASDKAATLYLKALIKGDAIETALKGAWAKVAGSSAITGSLDALGKAWGSKLGKAIGVTAGAFIIAEILISTSQNAEKIASNVKDLQKQLQAALEAGSVEQLNTVRAGIQAQFDDLASIPFPGIADVAMKKHLQDLLAGIDQEIAKHKPVLADAVTGTVGPAINDGLERAGAQVDTKPLALAVTQAFGSDLAAQSGTATKYAREVANHAAGALAAQINQRRSDVDAAWQALVLGLKNAITPTQERARLLGYLASKELAKGLHSGDPAVRSQAAATKQTILDRLAELSPNAHNIGRKGMEELRKAMRSKDPQIRAAAKAIYNAAINPIKPIVTAAKPIGAAFTTFFAAGLRSRVDLVAAAAGAISKALSNNLRASSPTKEGPLSTLGGPEGWGARIARFFAKGLNDNLPNLSGLGSGLSLRNAVPNMAWTPPGGNYSAPSVTNNRGGNTYVAQVTGLVRAKNPLEIAWKMARFGDSGTLSDLRTPLLEGQPK
jgi:hypothetical protein